MSIMNPSGAVPVVQSVRGFDMRFAHGPWPYAEEEKTAIDTHWNEQQALNPALFDGRVLVARDIRIDAGVRARFIEIGFAQLIYWRDMGFPRDGSVYNAFGAAVVVASDGGVLLGEMAPHTSNASAMYFPAGTPDLHDLSGDTLDLEGSMLRELEEETGLGADIARPSEERWVIVDRPLVCCARRIDVDADTDTLQQRVSAWLAEQPDAELSAIRVVRSMAEVDLERTPAYTTALLRVLLPD